MRRLGLPGGPKRWPPHNRIRPSGSRTLRSGASRDISGRLCSTGLPNCSATSGGGRPSVAAVRWRGRDVEERVLNPHLRQCLKRIAEAFPGPGRPRHAWRGATRQANRCRPSRADGGWRWPGGSYAAEKGERTGVCAPGLRNRTGKVSERRGWPGADMAGRSVLRISNPGSHAVQVRAALTVCLCAGFLYAKGVPPRARPSAGWWLSAPIFRNTHNPDRRAPCRSIDGPPQE